MDMLDGGAIAAADLADWRKLAQGLHARYLIDDFGSGARFIHEVGEAGDALGHHPIVSIGPGYVDLELISDDTSVRATLAAEPPVLDGMDQDAVWRGAPAIDRFLQARPSEGAPARYATVARVACWAEPSA